MMLFLDAGHGPETKGKETPIHSVEQGFPYVQEFLHNRRIANEVYRLFKEEGIPCYKVYNETDDLSLRGRAEIANILYKMKEAKDAVFISIHHNACDFPSVHGAEFYVHPRASENSKRLSTELIGATAELDDKLLRKNPYKTSNFAVLRETKMPAVLIECAYMTNKDDCELIVKPEWPTMWSFIILHAIKNYYS